MVSYQLIVAAAIAVVILAVYASTPLLESALAVKGGQPSSASGSTGNGNPLKVCSHNDTPKKCSNPYMNIAG